MLKKNLLVITILLFSFLLISNNSFAQNEDKIKKTPEEMATKMADRMKQNLSLTDEQYQSVYNLFLQKIQDRQKNKENYKNLDEATRKQMKKQNKVEFKKQLESILSKDQIEKMQQRKENHKQNKSDKKNKKIKSDVN